MIRLFLKFSAGTWLAALISLLTIPVVTALIRPDEFGRAAMFTLVLGLGAQIAQLGADQAYVREYYAAGQDRAALLRHAVAAPLLAAVLIALAVLAFAAPMSNWLFGLDSPAAIVLLALGIVAAIFERFSSLAVRMAQRALTFSTLRVLQPLVAFAVTLAYALWVGPDFLAIASGYVLGLFAVAAIGVLLSRSEWRFGPVRWSDVRPILTYGLPFVPTFAALWLFEASDKLVLRYLSDFTQLGLFSAAFRFVALLAIVQAGFTTFWVPVSFELFERDAEEARRTFSRALAVMGAILFPAACAILLAREGIILLFASDYRDAMLVMPFLLLVPLMYALSEVTAGGINYARRPRLHLMIAVGCAILNLALNLMFVPPLGARGAALATGIAYVAFFAARTLAAQRLFPLHLRLGRLVLAILMFAIAAAACSFAPTAAGYAAAAMALAATLLLYLDEYGALGWKAYRSSAR